MPCAGWTATPGVVAAAGVVAAPGGALTAAAGDCPVATVGATVGATRGRRRRAPAEHGAGQAQHHQHPAEGQAAEHRLPQAALQHLPAVQRLRPAGPQRVGRGAAVPVVLATGGPGGRAGGRGGHGAPGRRARRRRGPVRPAVPPGVAGPNRSARDRRLPGRPPARAAGPADTPCCLPYLTCPRDALYPRAVRRGGRSGFGLFNGSRRPPLRRRLPVLRRAASRARPRGRRPAPPRRAAAAPLYSPATRPREVRHGALPAPARRRSRPPRPVLGAARGVLRRRGPGRRPRPPLPRAPRRLDGRAGRPARSACCDALGLDPAVGGRAPRSARRPSRPAATGTVDRSADGYRIELVELQTAPRVYASALLYLPAGVRRGDAGARLPAVYSPHGHYRTGKHTRSIQIRCANLARRGYAVLIMDAVGHAERTFMGHREPAAHALLYAGASLPGLQVLDNIRGLDYLQLPAGGRPRPHRRHRRLRRGQPHHVPRRRRRARRRRRPRLLGRDARTSTSARASASARRCRTC